MATMVALILNKGESVSKTYAGANSFTDCVGHWASGAIALASAEGIISGVGNGLFKPNDPVTGAQACRMLVSALGYDTKSEGIGGAQWATKAVSVAKRAGLLDDLDGMNVNAVLTRDQACQMMFNALKADMVEYETKATSVDLGTIGSINVGGSSAKSVTQSVKANYDKTNPGDTAQQLCEEYFPKLEMKAATKDSEGFGRTAHEWTYKKNATVGPYTAEPDFVYTANMNDTDGIKAIEKDLKSGFKIGANNLPVKGNGSGTVDVSADANTAATSIASKTGNGVVVEVYLTDGEVTNVVQITPSVGTLKVKEVAANKSHGAYTEYSIKDAAGNKGKLFSTIVDEDKDIDTAVIPDGVKDGDVVTYYMDKSKVGANDENALHVFATTQVSGLVTRIKNEKDVTIGGTVYSKSGATGANIPVISEKKESTVALDQYGYIVDVVESSSETLYGFVLDNASYSKLDGNKVNWVPAVQIVTTEGKVEILDLDGDTYEDADALTAAAFVGKVVTYTEEDGVYTLVNVTDNSTDSLNLKDNVSTVSVITKGTSKFTKGTGNKVNYGGGSTLYVFADYEDNKLTGTVTTYTGYKNVPSYTLTGAANDLAVAVNTSDGGGTIADVVFVMTKQTAASSDDYVYVVGKAGEVAGSKMLWDVIVKGEASTVTTTKTELNIAANKMYKKLVIANNVVDTGKTVDDTANSYKSIKYAGDILEYVDKDSASDVYDVASDVPVYRIDTDAGEAMATLTAADIKDVDISTTAEGTDVKAIHMVVDDTTVTAIYILYK